MFTMVKVPFLLLVGLFSLANGGPIKQHEEIPYSWLFESLEFKAQNPGMKFNPKSTNITTCGGLISGSSDLAYIDYQPATSYSPNTRCIYGIHSYVYPQIKIFVNSMSSASGINGITVFTHGESRFTLDVNKLPNQDQHQYTFNSNNYPVYIMFSSDAIGTGLGYSFAVQSVGYRSSVQGPHNFVNSSSGSALSHSGKYSHNERSITIIQPPVASISTVKVTKLDTEAGYDDLNIYTLVPYHTTGSLVFPSRFSGNHPFGPPASETSSTEPRILLFTSDGGVRETGYSYSWSSAA